MWRVWEEFVIYCYVFVFILVLVWKIQNSFPFTFTSGSQIIRVLMTLAKWWPIENSMKCCSGAAHIQIKTITCDVSTTLCSMYCIYATSVSYRIFFFLDQPTYNLLHNNPFFNTSVKFYYYLKIKIHFITTKLYNSVANWKTAHHTVNGSGLILSSMIIWSD